MALLLKGGHLIDPAVGLDDVLDVVIRDGRIAEIGENLTISKGETVDCAGKIIVPGLIDMHVHLREPGQEYKETIATGTRAAAHGGFVGVCAIANTDPVVDEGATVRFILERAASDGKARVYPYGAITKGLQGKELAEMGDMLEAGAVAFTDDGRGVQSPSVMRKAMDYAKMFDAVIVSHSEDESLVGSGCVNEGVISTRLGLPGAPSLGETLAVMRDIELSRLTGCKVHIAHVSTKESVEAIRRAKAEGVAVTAEATPHHLVLTEDMLDESYDTNFKMNPPLRCEEDRQALVAGLLDGTIDCIATDHAPHAPHEKEVEFELAAFGTVGLETALPLMLTYMVGSEGMSLGTLVQRMAHGPRSALGLPPVELAATNVADITIIDIERPINVTTDWLVGRSKNSAFLGRALKGCASDVLVGGYFTLRNGEVTE